MAPRNRLAFAAATREALGDHPHADTALASDLCRALHLLHGICKVSALAVRDPASQHLLTHSRVLDRDLFDPRDLNLLYILSVGPDDSSYVPLGALQHGAVLLPGTIRLAWKATERHARVCLFFHAKQSLDAPQPSRSLKGLEASFKESPFPSFTVHQNAVDLVCVLGDTIQSVVQQCIGLMSCGWTPPATVVERRQSLTLSRGSENVPPLHAGYLSKQGATIKNWRRRWFVLTCDALSYYETRRDKKALGSIPLTNCTLEVSDSGSALCSFMLHTPGRTYYLSADTRIEDQKWIELLEAALSAVSDYVYLENTSAWAAVKPPSGTSLVEVALPSLQRVRKVGLLVKQGATVKNWKRRLFVLQPKTAQYFKEAKLAGTIDLANSIASCTSPEPTDNGYEFQIITPGRTYFVCAESAAAAREWVHSFTAARDMALPSDSVLDDDRVNVWAFNTAPHFTLPAHLRCSGFVFRWIEDEARWQQLFFILEPGRLSCFPHADTREGAIVVELGPTLEQGVRLNAAEPGDHGKPQSVAVLDNCFIGDTLAETYWFFNEVISEHVRCLVSSPPNSRLTVIHGKRASESRICAATVLQAMFRGFLARRLVWIRLFRREARNHIAESRLWARFAPAVLGKTAVPSRDVVADALVGLTKPASAVVRPVSMAVVKMPDMDKPAPTIAAATTAAAGIKPRAAPAANRFGDVKFLGNLRLLDRQRAQLSRLLQDADDFIKIALDDKLRDGGSLPRFSTASAGMVLPDGESLLLSCSGRRFGRATLHSEYVRATRFRASPLNPECVSFRFFSDQPFLEPCIDSPVHWAALLGSSLRGADAPLCSLFVNTSPDGDDSELLIASRASTMLPTRDSKTVASTRSFRGGASTGNTGTTGGGSQRAERLGHVLPLLSAVQAFSFGPRGGTFVCANQVLFLATTPAQLAVLLADFSRAYQALHPRLEWGSPEMAESVIQSSQGPAQSLADRLLSSAGEAQDFDLARGEPSQEILAGYVHSAMGKAESTGGAVAVQVPVPESVAASEMGSSSTGSGPTGKREKIAKFIKKRAGTVISMSDTASVTPSQATTDATRFKSAVGRMFRRQRGARDTDSVAPDVADHADVDEAVVDADDNQAADAAAPEDGAADAPANTDGDAGDVAEARADGAASTSAPERSVAEQLKWYAVRSPGSSDARRYLYGQTEIWIDAPTTTDWERVEVVLYGGHLLLTKSVRNPAETRAVFNLAHAKLTLREPDTAGSLTDKSVCWCVAFADQAVFCRGGMLDGDEAWLNRVLCAKIHAVRVQSDRALQFGVVMELLAPVERQVCAALMVQSSYRGWRDRRAVLRILHDRIQELTIAKGALQRRVSPIASTDANKRVSMSLQRQETVSFRSRRKGRLTLLDRERSLLHELVDAAVQTISGSGVTERVVVHAAMSIPAGILVSSNRAKAKDAILGLDFDPTAWTTSFVVGDSSAELRSPLLAVTSGRKAIPAIFASLGYRVPFYWTLLRDIPSDLHWKVRPMIALHFQTRPASGDGAAAASKEELGMRNTFTPFDLTKWSQQLESHGFSSHCVYVRRDEVLVLAQSPEIVFKSLPKLKAAGAYASADEEWTYLQGTKQGHMSFVFASPANARPENEELIPLYEDMIQVLLMRRLESDDSTDLRGPFNVLVRAFAVFPAEHNRVVTKLYRLLASKSLPLEGYLYKRWDKNGLAGWQKRWFYLKADRLYYYKKQEDPRPISFIQVQDIKDLVMSSENGQAMTTMSLVTEKKTYVLTDKSSDDQSMCSFDTWFQSISKARKIFGTIYDIQYAYLEVHPQHAKQLDPYKLLGGDEDDGIITKGEAAAASEGKERTASVVSAQQAAAMAKADAEAPELGRKKLNLDSPLLESSVCQQYYVVLARTLVQHQCETRDSVPRLLPAAQLLLDFFGDRHMIRSMFRKIASFHAVVASFGPFPAHIDFVCGHLSDLLRAVERHDLTDQERALLGDTGFLLYGSIEERFREEKGYFEPRQVAPLWGVLELLALHSAAESLSADASFFDKTTMLDHVKVAIEAHYFSMMSSMLGDGGRAVSASEGADGDKAAARARQAVGPEHLVEMCQILMDDLAGDGSEGASTFVRDPDFVVFPVQAYHALLANDVHQLASKAADTHPIPDLVNLCCAIYNFSVKATQRCHTLVQWYNNPDGSSGLRDASICLERSLDRARDKLSAWVVDACRQDKLEAVSDTSLHSSSVVDVFSASAQLVDFVPNLDPEVLEFLAEDVLLPVGGQNVIKYLSTLIEMTVRQYVRCLVARCQADGNFKLKEGPTLGLGNVTSAEKSALSGESNERTARIKRFCVCLNNLHQCRLKLADLLSMYFEDVLPEDDETFSSTLKRLKTLQGLLLGSFTSAVVGSAMDQHVASFVNACKADQSKGKYAIAPLRKFLDAQLEVVAPVLYPDLFQKALRDLFDTVIRTLKFHALPELVPRDFAELDQVTMPKALSSAVEEIRMLFHANGAGLSLTVLDKGRTSLEEGVDMYNCSSEMLMNMLQSQDGGGVSEEEQELALVVLKAKKGDKDTKSFLMKRALTRPMSVFGRGPKASFGEK